MKNFTVTLAFPRNPEIVSAEYFRVDEGCLIFRSVNREVRADREGVSSYPITVKIFAPGVWATVEETS